MSKLLSSLLIFIFVFKIKIFSQNTVPQNLNTKEKIGWISFDKNRDDSSFSVCDEFNIEEYYQVTPSYYEGLQDIRKYFQPYNNTLNKLCQKDGYIVVRFVINCQGKTDRYRVKFISLNYFEELNVNEDLKKKIINLISGMDKWIPGKYNGKNYDCYQNLKFLFKNYTLIDILY